MPFLFRRLWPSSTSLRTAMVLSPLSSLPNFSCHNRLFSSSPRIDPVPPCIFHILPLCELYSIALPQGHIGASSFSPRLLVYLFLSGRSRPATRNRSFSVSHSSMDRADTFSFLFFLLTPRKSLKCSSCVTLFLTASLSLISILSFIM